MLDIAYISPETRVAQARAEWLREHPAASAAELLDAINAIEITITTGEYREVLPSGFGDRYVWVQEAQDVGHWERHDDGPYVAQRVAESITPILITKDGGAGGATSGGDLG